MADIAGSLGGINKMQDCAKRETAQVIIRRELDKHRREFSAWNYLDMAVQLRQPTAEEEAALWELLIRARSNRS